MDPAIRRFSSTSRTWHLCACQRRLNMRECRVCSLRPTSSMQWTADNLQGLPGPDGSLPGKSLVPTTQPESNPADDPLWWLCVRRRKELF